MDHTYQGAAVGRGCATPPMRGVRVVSSIRGFAARSDVNEKPLQVTALTAGSIISHCTFADGGIDAAGDLGNFILITALGWIGIFVYLGIALKKVTGKKRYIFASPIIPWLSILLMIAVAVLLGISIDSLVRINSSLAESIGLFASLALLMMVCALVYWKGKNKLSKQISTRVLAPTILASYLWLDAFVT